MPFFRSLRISVGFVFIALMLGACGSDSAPDVPAPEATPEVEAPTVPEAPTNTPDASAEPAANAETSGSTESICLAAVAEQTGVPASDLSVISMDESQAGTSVMIQVPDAEAPWNCAVDTDGQTVVNVYYTGDEGAL